MGAHAGGRRSLRTWIEARLNLTEIASFLSVFGLLPAELDTRKPLREALDEALSRPLPSHARWPRILGILSFILFLLLAVTGMMLSFYYQPTTSEAYGSVTSIARDVTAGTLVGQVHHWAATLLLLILAARIIRFYFGGMYGRPREVIWMLAILTFVAATFADLTGRLLPWDARGYWTTVRASEVTEALPIIGPMFSLVAGGPGLDSLVLTRFYVLHMIVLPLLLVVLFYLHFSSARRVGLSAGVAPQSSRTLRVTLYDLLLIIVFLIGALATLAILLPQPFDAAADPFTTPPGARPPWYLLGPHALLESFPAFVPRVLRGLFLEALFAAALFLPFLDRRAGDRPGRRPPAIALGIIALLLWATLIWKGWHLEGPR